MARLEWSRIEPGDVEALVSMLLCRENPSAVRVRPSRGDGGIDVLVPSPDADDIDVYQVKSFASNLTTSQKAQAERSFRRLVDYAGGRGLKVSHWYLTLPLCPTNENLSWLSSFTSGHDIKAEWRGLHFLEGLAGTYPAVVDYYLRDGKDRLQAALESLTTVLRTSLQIGSAAPGGRTQMPAGALQPAEVVSTLDALHAALNEHDPHFRYDFSVDSACPEIPDQPGLVAAVQENAGDRWVTIKVLTHCDEALVERPVPLSLKITANRGSELHDAIEAFDKYGTPFTAPAGTVDADLALPGGLGGALTGGSARIELAGPRTTGHDVRLQVVDQAGDVVAEALVHMELPTTGPSRRGIRVQGTEQHGLFDLEILTDLDAQTVRYTLHHRDPSGKPPAQAVPGLRLLRDFHHPHGLRIAAPYGPALHRPDPLPENAGTEAAAGLLFDIADALATIQNHTTTQLVIPELATLTHLEARTILHVAELLRGAAIPAPWEGFTIHLWPGMDVPSNQIFSGLLYEELNISDGTSNATVGFRQIYLPAARIEEGSATRHHDHQDVRIVPAGGAPAVIRYAPTTPSRPETGTQHRT